MSDAPWLESDEEFEGVGAHPDNPRYDPVDEDDPELVDTAPLAARHTLAHTEHRRLTAAVLPAHYVQRLDGIDISHHQPDFGPMDLGVVRRIPTDWICQKATQSVKYVDPWLARVRSQADLLGFRHRSFYHWLSSTTDPIRQAVHALNTLRTLAPGEGVMLDAEEAGITVDTCLAWCEAIEKATRRPVSVYSGLYVAGGAIWRDERIREGKYGPRPMHLAAYVTRASLLTHLTRTGTLDLPIHAWQFSSNGPVAGITGRCDMNTVLDRAPYDRACGVAAVVKPPTPTPAPMPTPEGDDDEMVIITNSGDWVDFDGTPRTHEEAKLVLMDDGRLRQLNGDEWVARGGAGGTQWTPAQIAKAGKWTPPGSVPTPAPMARNYRATIAAHELTLTPVEG